MTSEVDVTALEVVLERIRAQADVENIRVTQHAQQEMVEENIILDDSRSHCYGADSGKLS